MMMISRMQQAQRSFRIFFYFCWKREKTDFGYLLSGNSEFESTLGVGDGQGGLACCGPWGRKELDTPELSCNEKNRYGARGEGCCGGSPVLTRRRQEGSHREGATPSEATSEAVEGQPERLKLLHRDPRSVRLLQTREGRGAAEEQGMARGGSWGGAGRMGAGRLQGQS